MTNKSGVISTHLVVANALLDAAYIVIGEEEY
jgi:hypothetical protein